MADTPQAPQTEAEAKDITIAITPAMIDEAVNTIHRLGLGIAKILMLDHEDVPRLIVSASCRSLEQMIEVYDARRGASKNLTENALLRQNVHALATNLRDALAEALTMTDRVRESLAVKGEGE